MSNRNQNNKPSQGKKSSSWDEVLTFKRFPKSGAAKYFQVLRADDGAIVVAMGEYGQGGMRQVIKLDDSEAALLCFALARELLR